MLDNTITLQVDILDDDVLVPEVYSRYDEYQNRTIYAGPNHALDAPNTMTVYRTFPKPTNNFRGVAKSTCKFSTAVTVPGSDASDQLAYELGEIGVSLPVGTSAARALALRQRMRAALDAAFMSLLNEKLEI